MSMPKGFTADNGYATVRNRGGKGYREIAEIMSEKGFPMKHSAARNYFLSGMRKLAAPIMDIYDLSPEEAERIALDPRFQEALADIMEEEGIKL